MNKNSKKPRIAKNLLIFELLASAIIVNGSKL